MTDAAAVRAFVEHWERVELNEKAVAQSHFNDLCHLLGLKGPVEADPKGQFYRFEKPLTKAGGSAGFAFRVNLLGFAVGEVDFVHPNQRPGKGWTWQFGLQPGF